VNIQHTDDELEQWQELDGLARLAEQKLQDVGQLCATPQAAALVQDAFDKRQAADSYLLRVLRPTKDRSCASDGQTRSRQTGRQSIGPHQTAASAASPSSALALLSISMSQRDS
jgi:hypothetical protein